MRITSLRELKAWNNKPTADIPILYEWFMEAFYTDVVDQLDMFNEFVRFCEYCKPDVLHKELCEGQIKAWAVRFGGDYKQSVVRRLIMEKLNNAWSRYEQMLFGLGEPRPFEYNVTSHIGMSYCKVQSVWHLCVSFKETSDVCPLLSASMDTKIALSRFAVVFKSAYKKYIDSLTFRELNDAIAAVEAACN